MINPSNPSNITLTAKNEIKIQFKDNAGEQNQGNHSPAFVIANNAVMKQPTEGIANNLQSQLKIQPTPEDKFKQSSLANLNLNASKITFDPQSEIHQTWNQKQNGLTTTGQLQIAIAATAVAIGTGGIGAGISGAMITAATTTAATTATISATNAGLNAEGNFLKAVDDVGRTAVKDTTSKESLRNMAISAAVAGAASWAVEASGGTTSLEKGKDYAVYKPDPKLMANDPKYRAFVEANYPNYNGVIDPSVNNIGMANSAPKTEMIGQRVPAYSNNPLTGSFWNGFLKEGGFISSNANKVGGMNSMSTMHDPWGQNAIVGTSPVLQLTIPPAIAVQYCATFPAACGAVVSGSMNNEFGTKK